MKKSKQKGQQKDFRNNHSSSDESEDDYIRPKGLRAYAPQTKANNNVAILTDNSSSDDNDRQDDSRYTDGRKQS